MENNHGQMPERQKQPHEYYDRLPDAGMPDADRIQEYRKAPEPAYRKAPEPEYRKAPEPEYRKAPEPEYNRTSEYDRTSEYSRKSEYSGMSDFSTPTEDHVSQTNIRSQEYRRTLQERAEADRIPMVGEEPMSVVEWLTVYILLAIPVVNMIMVIGWLFGWGKKSRTNFVRASLLLSVIMTVILILFYFRFGALMQNFLQQYSTGY